MIRILNEEAGTPYSSLDEEALMFLLPAIQASKPMLGRKVASWRECVPRLPSNLLLFSAWLMMHMYMFLLLLCLCLCLSPCAVGSQG